MKRLSIVLLAMCYVTVLSATIVTYTPDDESIFPNPERGFITMPEGHLTEKNPYCIKGNEGVLENHASTDKGTLILAHYYLENYKNTATIPEKVLNAFDEDMQVLRKKGMKAIVRFSYTNATYGKGEAESAADASLEIVKSHIEQYKSHWQANADVIFCFQAGFIGAWGEWYYTDHFGNQGSEINDNRRAVIDALLAAVPADRCIQIRTPLFKTGYIGNTNALTAEEAHTGTPKARLGHHNDAFLTSSSDMGTYSNPSKQKKYIAQETLYVPLGGESCIDSDSKAEENATFEKTTAEMSSLHWTFIQSGYSTHVTGMWRKNGTFDELNRKMGYRYQLVNGTFSNEVVQGGKLSVDIELKNVGYAPLYNERHAYIVLKGEKTYSLPLQSDPRRWLPNGEVSMINEELTIPAEVPAGTYELYLYLPDAYESIASDARFAVRFANTGVWDNTTGMNKLNASVVVSSSGSTPPDDPPTPPTPEDVVVLPATLDKTNVSGYSEDMTWYNSDYFNYGEGDTGFNLDRWAEWKVEVKYPGKYVVSENGYYPNGHNYLLQLMKNGSIVSDYSTEKTYEEGEISITQKAKWDLSAVSKNGYILRVKNAMQWGQPKLKSITLSYDGEISTNMENSYSTADIEITEQGNDLLGRPVDELYKGIVIYHGRKIIRL